MNNKTTLVEIFGHSTVIKVLGFLISFQLYGCPLTEIAKKSEIGYSTLKTFWDHKN